MAEQRNDRQRNLILTGASRGIGHATVKRFSAAGWRVNAGESGRTRADR